MVHPSWSAATRGIETPAARQTNCVNPEQSKVFGPVAPHT
jgi:hypothetical protein